MPQDSAPQPQKPLAFDEYRLVYDSAERVTDRRVELNRWNYSINVAILIAVAAIANWSFQNPPLFWFATVAAGVLCLMAIFLCSLWIGQVRDMKLLNNAKFKVLEEMAPRVEFDLGPAGIAESWLTWAVTCPREFRVPVNFAPNMTAMTASPMPH